MSPSVGPVRRSGSTARRNASREDEERLTDGGVRSDSGPEFMAKAVQEWIIAVSAKTAYIQPGSPWENGYVESFNRCLRDELSTRSAARLTRIQAASTGGVHAFLRRVAGCATPTGSAGHAGAAANVELTFQSATQRGLITACQDARGCLDAQGDPRAGKLVELPTRRWLMLCWH